MFGKERRCGHLSLSYLITFVQRYLQRRAKRVSPKRTGKQADTEATDECESIMGDTFSRDRREIRLPFPVMEERSGSTLLTTFVHDSKGCCLPLLYTTK